MFTQETADVAQPTRESHVSAEANRLGNRIEELHKQIEVLRNRLSPVLRNTPPQGNGQAGIQKEPEQLVPLAQRLRKFSQQIQAMGHAVDDLCGSLEL